MNRVQTNKVGAPLGHIVHQNSQIGEITHTPVLFTAQTVELDARTPYLAAIGNGRLLVAGLGGKNNTHCTKHLASLLHGQLMVTQWQISSDGNTISLVFHVTKMGNANHFTIHRHQCSLDGFTLLGRYFPGQLFVDQFDGQTQLQRNRFASANNHHRIQRTLPVLAFLFFQLGLQGHFVIHLVTHGRQHGRLAFQSDLSRIAPSIYIIISNALGTG